MPPESYFTDDSMVRRVHREFVVGLAGPRTLLLQATHPVAFAGFFAHTGALDEPYERLARTAQVMDAITFGPPSMSVSLPSTATAVAPASSTTVAGSFTATGGSSTQVTVTDTVADEPPGVSVYENVSRDVPGGSLQ